MMATPRPNREVVVPVRAMLLAPQSLRGQLSCDLDLFFIGDRADSMQRATRGARFCRYRL